LYSLEGHTDAVYSVAFANDMIISASLDKTMRVWMPSGNRYNLVDTLSHHKDFCLSVSVSPDARWIASSSKDRVVQIYELAEDGKCELQLTLQGHRNSVITSAFSPAPLDGSLMFATGSGDSRARIWKIDIV
jgi:general transcriptional corepressor TUP1